MEVFFNKVYNYNEKRFSRSIVKKIIRYFCNEIVKKIIKSFVMGYTIIVKRFSRSIFKEIIREIESSLL